ncbi:MAG: hypothetical protein PHI97_19405 [Desulfobulbus sp.]|nr:hypothetical protein [Desulfobulbus sp.]
MDLHFSAILGWFSSLAGRFLGDTAIKFVAYKTLIFTFLTVTLPVIAKNFMTWLFEELVATASSNMNTDGLDATVLHFSGIAGYLASHLMLADCLSIIITAIVIRFTLNFIPFVG